MGGSDLGHAGCSTGLFTLERRSPLMALTKAQIIEAIAEQNGFTKIKSLETVETLLELIKKTLESGEDVLISGFGKFCVNEKKPRKGRNPATGENMMLAPRRVVTFRCSRSLRDKINK
jgi:integration host factor subunit alpha